MCLYIADKCGRSFVSNFSLSNRTNAIQAEALQLIYSGRYGEREDFAAVVQPFFRNTLLPLDSVGPVLLSPFARIGILISVRHSGPCHEDSVFFSLHGRAAQGGPCGQSDGGEGRKSRCCL